MRGSRIKRAAGNIGIAALLAAASVFPASAEQPAGGKILNPERVEVSEGIFLPLFGAGDPPLPQQVGGFLFDVYPVTNQDFKQFIEAVQQLGLYWLLLNQPAEL